jgi:hypothetical protein
MKALHSTAGAGRLPRLFLRLFLGFLVVTALLAIGIVLLGDMNDTQERILGTSSIISAASVAAMVCAAFRGRARRPWLGAAGIALAGATAAGAIAMVWTRLENEAFGRSLACLTTVATATALAELLWLLPLHGQHRRLQQATTATIAGLALLICLQVAFELNSEFVVRTTIAVAIVVALAILAHPILWKLRPAPVEPTRLVLLHEHDDVWTDGNGHRYSVRQLEPPAGGARHAAPG